LNNQDYILNQFESILLSEMDSVKLMDRIDTKFVFNEVQLPEILKSLLPHYRILDVNGHRISRYESLYFDTKNFDLYQKHYHGKLNRYKVRYRKYLESDMVFFEVKFKNNKGRTIKNRVRQEEISVLLNEKSNQLLKDKAPGMGLTLEANMWVNYSRITLVNKLSSERVTIDLGMHFKNEVHAKQIENIIIAEVKQQKSAMSPFMMLMRQQHIRAVSISKYCLGIMSLFENVKHNNFKPTITHINKIANVHIASR
jgi:acid stress-induced BolA-like protein IbaG/YrbA